MSTLICEFPGHERVQTEHPLCQCPWCGGVYPGPVLSETEVKNKEEVNA